MAVAAMAVYMQAGRPPYAVAPSPRDLVGALRIGLLQHATLLGGALAAFLAGMSMGEDLRAGTAEMWRLSDPRWWRRWIRRVGTLTSVMVASSTITALALRVTASADAFGARSSARDLLVDGLPALAVIAWYVAVSLAVALVVRNALLMVVLAVGTLTIATRAGGPWLEWVLPSGWVGNGLHLTENGTSINYLAQKSPHLARFPSQAIALAVVVVATAAFLAIGAVHAERRARSGG